MGLWNHSTNLIPKGSILPQNPEPPAVPTLQKSRKTLELLPWGGNWEWRALSAPLGSFPGSQLRDPAEPWMWSGDKDRERHLVKELLLKPEKALEGLA